MIPRKTKSHLHHGSGERNEKQETERVGGGGSGREIGGEWEGERGRKRMEGKAREREER